MTTDRVGASGERVVALMGPAGALVFVTAGEILVGAARVDDFVAVGTGRAAWSAGVAVAPETRLTG